MTTLLESDLTKLALAWIAADPDPETRAEIKTMLSKSEDSIHDIFGSVLPFGTAGLRGRLGPGPTQMNQVLVRLVAAALAIRVRQESDPRVVVGFDARRKSYDFALDTARVLAAKNIPCLLLPRPLPTPVVAFTIKQLDANAGVMITASHNPSDENGYKVFWDGGAQITPPIDSEITELIKNTPLLTENDLAEPNNKLIEIGQEHLVRNYVDTIAALVEPDSPRSTRVAYTPLHGVGNQTLQEVFAAAEFPAPTVVEIQSKPDPEFPTAPFPNPEDASVIEPLLQLASEISADVALANDPDADRLAVAVPNNNGWQVLTGDDVGCILAEHLLRRPSVSASNAQRLVINTFVSSRLLADIAEHHNAMYVETLAGFKWIMSAQHDRENLPFVLGYEEALGYSIGSAVRDKDGISTALLVTELVGIMSAQGKTILDLLDEIHLRHGVHVTGQRSIRFDSANQTALTMNTTMDSFRNRTPHEIAGMDVIATIDLRNGTDVLPATNAVILNLKNGRIIVRPSGTEPKIKVYGEIVTSADPQDLIDMRAKARVELKDILKGTVRYITELSIEPFVSKTPSTNV